MKKRDSERFDEHQRKVNLHEKFVKQANKDAKRDSSQTHLNKKSQELSKLKFEN